jgi:DNA invertase Pin-like site-specific DNA recombinase
VQEGVQEGLSGATTKRPALQRCLKGLKDGDTLIVWKLDLLARSLRDLITLIEEFSERAINFRSLTDDISTTTPGGKLVFHIFAALAEFERGLIIERTRAGMKAARARRPAGAETKAIPAADRPRAEPARERQSPRGRGRPVQSGPDDALPGAGGLISELT